MASEENLGPPPHGSVVPVEAVAGRFKVPKPPDAEFSLIEICHGNGQKVGALYRKQETCLGRTPSPSFRAANEEGVTTFQGGSGASVEVEVELCAMQGEAKPGQWLAEQRGRRTWR
jgi:hypothetical protein